MTNNSANNGNHLESYVSPEEIDDLNWELEMAQLVGLTEESSSLLEVKKSQQPEQSPDKSSQAYTKESFSSNPFAKLGLVATFTLLGILFAGAFLSQIINGNHQQPKQNLNITEKQIDPLSEFTASSKEVESLKTKLALSQQEEAVKAAQQTLRKDKVNILTTKSPKTIQTINKTQIVYVPKTVTVERIVKVPQTSAVQITPSSKKVKPQNAPSNKIISAVTTQTPVQTNRLDISPPQSRRPPEVLKQFESRNSSIISNLLAMQSVSPGTTVKAVLATAVFGETTTTRSNKSVDEQGKNTFIVRLQEPLKAINESIVLPKDSEVLVEISSLSEQGLVHLAVIKALLKNNGNLIEKNIPKNAIIIRGLEGKPLIASQFPNQSDSITGMDLGSLTLGGIGKVASLFNRTQAQVMTTNATGTIVSNTNSPPDILMGLVEGGTSTVVPQITQRNQQIISQMMQRTNIWFVPAGTQVEVYVNQLVQF